MPRSFLDLEVYQNLYKAMLRVSLEVIPRLPKEENFSLAGQMRRACKAPLALIAEGYAKKCHKKEWRKYLNNAIGECNEMIVHLSCVKDIYATYVEDGICENLIKVYDISGKQLYRLAESWSTHNSSTQPDTQPTTHPHY